MNKHIRLQSMGTKIFLLFFISILIFVIVLGLVSYNISKTIVMNKSSNGMDQTIVQATQKLDLLFNLYEGLTTQMVTDKVLKDNINIYYSEMSDVEKINASAKVLDKLRNNRFTLPGIVSTALIATESNQMLLDNSSDDIANTANVIDIKLPWMNEIIKADGKAVWLGANNKGYTTKASKPVLAIGRLQKSYYSGKPVILVIEVSQSTISEQLKDIDIGKTGELRIINKEHRIVQSINDNDLGKQFFFPLLDGKEIQKQNDQNGNELLVISSLSKKTGWSLIGYTTVNELIAETKQIYQVTLITAICAILFAILIGWFAVRIFGRPLVKLRNIMKISESGDLTVRADFKSKDEIGQLGDSFNNMMVNFTNLIKNTNDSGMKVLEMGKTLLNTSRLTAVSAGEIVTVSNDIADGASELSIVAEKSNSLTRELSGKLNEVIGANERMVHIAGEVRSYSDKGIIYSQEVIGKTNSTNELTLEMFEKVNGLRESTASIQKVLELLNNMAKQTNILSLNASIEAARAGSAGKGFMVISNEIRNLADQSKQSIEVVGRITENIQMDIDSAVDAIEKAYPVFKEQIHMVQETDHIFNRVSDHMGDYTKQLNRVTSYIIELQHVQINLNEAMLQVSATSQESAAATEQVAALSTEQLGTSKNLVNLSEDLEKLSEELGKSLSIFTVC